jgi:ATP-dependent helicase/nuclease subunit B
MLRRVSTGGLLSAAAPKLRTIAPGADFLVELAVALAEDRQLADHPDALADDLIYVPNRRSARALALALYRAAGCRSILMPEIRPLGDLESNEPPPGAESALADLPPAVSGAQRRGQLARLVSHYYEAIGAPVPPASALSAARELERLLDQAAMSGDVDWSSLPGLVEDQQLAAHWESSVRFLTIITEQWPAELHEQQKMDPYARRLAAARATAMSWATQPPAGNVIIAGSTGADPSARALMTAALDLPHALIVFPGLDRAMSATSMATIAGTASHPQNSMARTLLDLGYQADEVAPWPGSSATHEAEARRSLIHEALAPANETAGWLKRLDELAGGGSREAFAERGFSGLALIEAADEEEEAWCAALLLREALDTDDKTAALVTPDAGLARRVSALMQQWDVHVAPSGGTPLLQTRAGSLAALVMDWTSDPTHPVAMLAALKHTQIDYAHDLEGFERHVLRGPRRWDDWESLGEHIERRIAETIANRKDDDDSLPRFAEPARAILADLKGRFERAGLDDPEAPIPGRTFLEEVSALMGDLGDAPLPWAGEDGAALARALRDFADICDSLEPANPAVWSDLFKTHCATLTVQAAGGDHPRLSIWGPLEARLQSADCLILAGLNEGVWPQQPPADAFLPRNFRKKLGIADPDERIGLSAHDFAQMASAPTVTLLSSKRRDDAPAVASRWIWRLQTLARGALGEDGARQALDPAEGRDPRRWLAGLRKPDALPDGYTSEPRPTPPVSARPRKLSVTRVEDLIRDPYKIYAQQVLKLYPLDALDLPVDARPRGTAIHAALETFEDDGQEKTPEALVALIEQELREAGEAEEVILGAVSVRRKVAAEYLDWRKSRLHEIQAVHTEIKGQHDLQVQAMPDGCFTITAEADRIERRRDGSLVILDFKTGAPPGEREVRIGLNPQLPLSALIAMGDGFGKNGPKIRADTVSALTYVRFASSFDVRNIGDGTGRTPEMPLDEIITTTREGVAKLIERFAGADHPYVSMPRPKWATYGSEYARLARRDEWISEGGDD